MSEPLTEQELAAIEERAKAATPGPWAADEDGDVCIATGSAIFLNDFVDGAGDANAEFVAHARADVPGLIAEVRRLRGNFETLRDNDDCQQDARRFALEVLRGDR